MKSFWEFFAGLGIFLYAMRLLEEALRNLAGRTFKLFLRKQTSSMPRAIAGGALVTTVLQSSSVVTLMTLAFVGAGVMSMRNALAVVIGSNLGTTFGNWIVVLLGFNTGIELFAYPLVAIAGLALLLVQRNKKITEISKFIFAFGLMFMGLEFMKESMSFIVKDFDFTPYLHLNLFLFVLLGFVLTALIQSSSATMVITLSALHAQVFPLENAAAIIVGSELGTTVKIWLGALGGSAAKKRIATGNVLFNFVITIIGYAFLPLLLSFIIRVMHITGPLLVLVMFQTLINLVAAAIFYPFMQSFSKLLEKMYAGERQSAAAYIAGARAADMETALVLMEKETGFFIHRVLRLNLEAFHIHKPVIEAGNGLTEQLQNKERTLRSYSEKYDNIKQAEGEIFSFYLKLKEIFDRQQNNQPAAERLERLISAIRNAMYSAKGMKNIIHNRRDLRDSANDIKYGNYKLFKSELEGFYKKINEVLKAQDGQQCFNGLMEAFKAAREDYDVALDRIQAETGRQTLDEKDLATLLNMNRELYSSCKAIIIALKDYLLERSLAKQFEQATYHL